MSKKLIYEIVLAYVTKERQRLVKPNQKALVLFDVSKGQTTDKVLSRQKDSNMEVVFVPTNMTGLLQPLDLTVNGYAKRSCNSKFNHCYISEITKQMDDGKCAQETDVKLQLTRLQPLHAEWLVELYNQLTTKEGKDIIMSGWKSAGIPQAIGTSSANQESLDPFSDIDPLISQVTHESNIAEQHSRNK